MSSEGSAHCSITNLNIRGISFHFGDHHFMHNGCFALLCFFDGCPLWYHRQLFYYLIVVICWTDNFLDRTSSTVQARFPTLSRLPEEEFEILLLTYLRDKVIYESMGLTRAISCWLTFSLWYLNYKTYVVEYCTWRSFDVAQDSMTIHVTTSYWANHYDVSYPVRLYVRN